MPRICEGDDRIGNEHDAGQHQQLTVGVIERRGGPAKSSDDRPADESGRRSRWRNGDVEARRHVPLESRADELEDAVAGISEGDGQERRRDVVRIEPGGIRPESRNELLGFEHPQPETRGSFLEARHAGRQVQEPHAAVRREAPGDRDDPARRNAAHPARPRGGHHPHEKTGLECQARGDETLRPPSDRPTVRPSIVRG